MYTITINVFVTVPDCKESIIIINIPEADQPAGERLLLQVELAGLLLYIVQLEGQVRQHHHVTGYPV
jgi:hypothetical protein